MALHPFQSFRKHQKKFLGILTIFVMFIFILYSYSGRGGGDPIDRLMSLFGASSKKDKTPVTTLYGKTVTVGDLDELKMRRRLVDTFMENALREGRPRLSPEEQTALETRMKEINDKVTNNEIIKSIEESIKSLDERIKKLPAGQANQELQKQRQQQIQTLFQLDDVFRKPLIGEYRKELLEQNKTNLARYINRPEQVSKLFTWMYAHPRELYFGGGLSGEDLLDFKIWLQQADRLNIALTDEDVRKEINRETESDLLTNDQSKNDAEVRRLLGSFGRAVESKELYAALRDEYRVRLAKEMFLGGTPGARSALAAAADHASDRVALSATPAQFWEFYKDNFTELRVEFLKVPAAPFVAQVNKKLQKPGGELTLPSEDVLKQLFERYKAIEPNPERAEPGFKVPRRAKVAWIAADPSAEYYRKAAKEALPDKVVPVLPVADALTAVPAAGGLPCGGLGWAARVAASVADPVQLEYGKYVNGLKSRWDAPPNRPEAIAAFVGQIGLAAGQLSTQGPPQGVAATLAAVAKSQQDIFNRDASMVLAAANPFPLAVAAQEAALSNVSVPSFDDKSKEMVERARYGLALGFARVALDSFTKEVEAKRADPDPDKAEKAEEKYFQDNANPEHGITEHGIMDKSMSELEIADAPALAPLRRAYAGLTPLDTQSRRAFAVQFFEETIRRPDQQKPDAKGTFQPERLTTASGDTRYYYWLTKKDEPEVLTFDKARTQVEDAWKLDKARELARKKAEEIIANLKQLKQGTSLQTHLEDEAAQLKKALGVEDKSLTHTTPISKMVEEDSNFRAPYVPYSETKLGIENPPSGTAANLLKSLKNAGDATILQDIPDRNYYVAVLLSKTNPPLTEDKTVLGSLFSPRPNSATKKSFLEAYREATGPVPNPLWGDFLTKQEQQYATELMRQLREQAGAPLNDEDGEYKMDPEVRKRLHSDWQRGMKDANG